jgi:hypothetical protein
MKALISALIILILIHVLAAIGFVGWLSASDRLDRGRVNQVIELFSPTMAEQAAAEEEAAALQAQTEAARDQLLRLERVANGPKSVEDRLMENFEQDEIAMHRLERLQAETESIRRRLDQDKQLLAQQSQELEQKRRAFEEEVAMRSQEMQTEDFKRAVKTLEQLPPRQAKQVLQQIIAEGETEQAVDYLAEMQLRKSAGVLKAFKSEAEAAQVADLVERLRLRGVDTASDMAAAADQRGDLDE